MQLHWLMKVLITTCIKRLMFKAAIMRHMCKCIRVRTFGHCVHTCHVPLTAYMDLCTFPENAALVRIRLVKVHGLVVVHSLQSRAEQALTCIQKWLEEHYFAVMRRYSAFLCFYRGVIILIACLFLISVQ